MLSRQIHNPVMYLHLLLKFHCTDNKHELIQVVVAANVTTHKTPVSEASTLQTERLHTTARDFVS